MNTRIKELAEQAKANVPAGLLVNEWIDEYNRIFAELIVRECANRVDYWESRQGEHTEDLLKHFGVTE